jgi:hypothetical protein
MLLNPTNPLQPSLQQLQRQVRDVSPQLVQGADEVLGGKASSLCSWL